MPLSFFRSPPRRHKFLPALCVADRRRSMADAAPQPVFVATTGAADAVPELTNAHAGGRFPPKGQPQIVGFNRIGLWSLYMKEVRRFLKVQTQTVWAPAVTTLLYLIIFTVAMGRGNRMVLGVHFATFMVPGLIMMGMMTN